MNHICDYKHKKDWSNLTTAHKKDWSCSRVSSSSTRVSCNLHGLLWSLWGTSFGPKRRTPWTIWLARAAVATRDEQDTYKISCLEGMNIRTSVPAILVWTTEDSMGFTNPVDLCHKGTPTATPKDFWLRARCLRGDSGWAKMSAAWQEFGDCLYNP